MAAGENRRIIGIDPGTSYTGYGIIDTIGKSPRCVHLGYIELVSFTDPYEKLRQIYKRVEALILEYRPHEAAFESPFFGENVQSMLKLGRAQGVAMAAALNNGLPVYEYAPRRIKQAITGQGGASKEQVAAMLKSLLKVDYDLPRKLDATDGLAVALCHHYETSSPINQLAGHSCNSGPARTLKAEMSRSKKTSWEQFMTRNPERQIKKK